MLWLVLIACAGHPSGDNITVDTNADSEEPSADSDSSPEPGPIASHMVSGCEPGSWFPDADGDGYGELGAPFSLGCSPGDGWAPRSGDCDDTDPLVHPGATPRWCEGVDDDCDGTFNPCDDLPGAAVARIHGTVMDESVGRMVVGVGDVDGDGYDDVLTAAPNLGEGTDSQGEAYLFHGPVGGDHDVETADVVFAGDKAGVLVGAAGDLDADGRADLLVSEANVVYVISSPRPGRVDPSGVAVASTGSMRVAWAFSGGDLNGDSFDDLVIGDGLYSVEPKDYRGIVRVFDGPVIGAMDPSEAFANIVGLPEELLGGYGQLVHLDADGDGRQDIATRVHIDTNVEGGTVSIFGDLAPGTITGDDDLARIEGTESAESLGTSIAAPGDVDGDGYDDLFLGSFPTRPPYSSYEMDWVAGLVTGPFSDYRSMSDAWLRLQCSDPVSCSEPAVSAAGDLDGDGGADLALGTPLYTEAHSESSGAVWLLVDPPPGVARLEDVATAKILGEGAYSCAGAALAAGGDIDGDGTPDLLVGSEYWTYVDPSDGSRNGLAGAVWLLSGADL